MAFDFHRGDKALSQKLQMQLCRGSLVDIPETSSFGFSETSLRVYCHIMHNRALYGAGERSRPLKALSTGGRTGVTFSRTSHLHHRQNAVVKPHIAHKLSMMIKFQVELHCSTRGISTKDNDPSGVAR